MNDDQTPAPEAGEEVVRQEVEQIEPAQELEIEPGQGDTQPDKSAATPPEEEAVSKSKERRERRKELHRRMQQEAESARKALEDANAKLAEAREAAKDLPTPRPEEYGTTEEYSAALAAVAAAKMMDQREVKRLEAEAARVVQERENIAARRREEAVQNWQAHYAEGLAKYDDFDEVVSNPNLKISEKLSESLMMSEDAAGIAYYLGKNPETAAELSDMLASNDITLALEAAKEIGRIEALVSEAVTPNVTNAPEPITTVRPTATSSKKWEDMTPDEYAAWRSKGGSPNP